MQAGLGLITYLRRGVSVTSAYVRFDWPSRIELRNLNVQFDYLIGIFGDFYQVRLEITKNTMASDQLNAQLEVKVRRLKGRKVD